MGKLIGLGVFGFFVTWYLVLGGPGEAAIDVVKQDLRSPSEAKGVYSRAVSEGDWNQDGNKEYLVHVMIDAKNGFGNEVRVSYLVWVEDHSDGWKFRLNLPAKYQEVPQNVSQQHVDIYRSILGINDRSPASI